MLGPLGTDYSDCSSIGQAHYRRYIYTGKDGVEGDTYIKNFILGYQTKVDIGLMNNPSINLSNLGIAHPIPMGISMNNCSPSSEDATLPRSLAGPKPEPGKHPHPSITATFWESL